MILRARYRAPDRLLNPTEAAEVCLKCGACCVVRGHSCHVMYDGRFDPRRTYVYGCLGAGDPAGNPDIWLCVSCHRCEELCPYEVSPVRFIEAMKGQAFEEGRIPPMVRGVVAQVLSTGYAFPLTPSTNRLREALGLEPLGTAAAAEVAAIAGRTGMAERLRRMEGGR